MWNPARRRVRRKENTQNFRLLVNLSFGKAVRESIGDTGSAGEAQGDKVTRSQVDRNRGFKHKNHLFSTQRRGTSVVCVARRYEHEYRTSESTPRVRGKWYRRGFPRKCSNTHILFFPFDAAVVASGRSPLGGVAGVIIRLPLLSQSERFA